jgi:hypothetical protein
MFIRWLGRAIVVGIAGWAWRRLTQRRATNA